MTKEELITKIQTTFKDIKLDDGIGIWEGQGLDDYADSKTMAELRKKDERNNWNNISYQDLAYCQSSLSFFDAKGMRFALPKFMVFDILEKQIYEEQNVSAPDILFTLRYNLNAEHQKKQFSLFNKEQIETIILFLEYKQKEIISIYNGDITTYDYIEITKALNEWKQKINE